MQIHSERSCKSLPSTRALDMVSRQANKDVNFQIFLSYQILNFVILLNRIKFKNYYKILNNNII